MTDFDRDAERVRALLTGFDPGQVPAPDVARIVGLGERGARWRVVDRTLAVAVVAAIVVGAIVLFSQRVSPAPGPTGPSPSPTATSAGYALQIRPVVTVSPVGATPCPKTPVQTPAAEPATACTVDGTLVYTLGPAAVSGDVIASMRAEAVTVGGGFEVVVELTPAGSAAFETMTSSLVQQQAPQNQLAFYAQGRVLSAPSVTTAIVGGVAQIAGFATLAEAQDFVTAVTP
jgi:preprotein translocase subunit SecD